MDAALLEEALSQVDTEVDNEAAPIPEPPGPTSRTTRQGTIDLTASAIRNRRGRRSGRGRSRGGQSHQCIDGESTGPRQAPAAERSCPYRYPYPYGQSVSVRT